jgi:hypothetical protein
MISITIRRFKAIIDSCDASKPTMQYNDGNTPLHLVCNRRSMNMVVELCNSMTNPDDFLIKNNQGQTAYDISRSYEQIKLNLQPALMKGSTNCRCCTKMITKKFT